MKSILSNPLIRVLVPPFLGFLGYGAWAYWVNSEFGSMMAMKAAFTQGTYSFVITLVLAVTIEWLYRCLQALPKGHWLVAFFACLVLYSTSWGVNALAGTPNILLTILPGAAMSTIYTFVYVMTLVKLQPDPE